MVDMPDFLDKHRIQTGLQVQDRGDHLLVGPAAAAPSLTGLNRGIGLVGAAVVLLCWFNHNVLGSDEALWVVAMAFSVVLAMLEILRRIAAAESAKGPVLEIDQPARMVGLPRDGEQVPFDAVRGVELLVGPYQWTDAMIRVAELSLLIDTGEPAPVRVPVVMVHESIRRLEAVTARVVALLQIPSDPAMMNEHSRRKRTVWSR